MAKVPASLGDAQDTPLKKIQENFPLPTSRKEIVTAFERILNLGRVQRVLVQLDSPIRVTRFVEDKKVDTEGPEELPEDDVIEAAMNSKMEILPFENVPPTVYLFRAFAVLSHKKLKARTMVVNNFASLLMWLGLSADADVSSIFGIETMTSKTMPDDALLLVATPADDPDLVVFSLRLEMSAEKTK